MSTGLITVAPFGRASVSRPVEEAALDCEFPGPERLMVQLSMKQFVRKKRKKHLVSDQRERRQQRIERPRRTKRASPAPSEHSVDL